MQQSPRSINEILRILLEPKAPYVHILGLRSPHPLPAYDWPLEKLKEVTVRRCVARRCRDEQSFMREVAAAFQFPDYFGGNGAALSDCLSDLEWLRDSSHLIALIRDAQYFLDAESATRGRELVNMLEDAAKTLPNPEIAGWPAGAMPRRTMHWCLVCDPEQSRGVAERLGVQLLV